MRIIPLLLVTVAVGALCAPANAAVDTADFDAAMVYNFARFASWPPTRFVDAASPVTVCVSPSNPMTTALARLEGQPVGGRRLHVRQTATPNATCHVAVLQSDEATPGKLAVLHQQGVLTVGEGERFDGAVGLVRVGRQVRFQVNSRAAREAHVDLSSQLLRLAVSVR
jgi:hypothetical protein